MRSASRRKTARLEALIRELRASRAELVRKTRLAAIGETAAVIAHEVRNPLGALTNCVELLRGNPCLSGEDAELLAIIEGESRRLNEIVSDLLAFGRPRPRRPGPASSSRSPAGSSKTMAGASR